MAGPKPAALPLGDGPLIRLNRNLRITGVLIVTHSSQPFVNPPGESTIDDQRGKTLKRDISASPKTSLRSR